MTKEEAWLMWMNESKHYVEYDWDTIKKSSHWVAFSRGWDAASVNANGWDDAYKMGMEAGKELEQREWQGLTTEDLTNETDIANSSSKDIFDFRKAFWCGARWAEAKLKEKNNAV